MFLIHIKILFTCVLIFENLPLFTFQLLTNLYVLFSLRKILSSACGLI